MNGYALESGAHDSRESDALDLEEVKIECPECGGTGLIVNPVKEFREANLAVLYVNCQRCDGTGQIMQARAPVRGVGGCHP